MLGDHPVALLVRQINQLGQLGRDRRLRRGIGPERDARSQHYSGGDKGPRQPEENLGQTDHTSPIADDVPTFVKALKYLFMIFL
jgi:hypothetical protein